MSTLPPGPTSLGFFSLIRAGFFDPIPVLERLASEYGDTIRVATYNGTMTVTSNPEGVRAIYTADPDSFDAWGAHVGEPVFGTTSLVVSSGARHRRDRKLLTPPFNASTMRAYGATIAAAARSEVARLRPGSTFSMLEAAQNIALDVIIRVVFGMEGEERVARTREVVLGLIDSLSPLFLLFPALRRSFGGLGPWAKNQRARAALDALLIEEIRARRAGTARREDILALMLEARYDDGSAMSEAELSDQLRTLLFAGHETTAVTLAWAVYWLHREKDTLDRLLAEIDALGPSPDPHALSGLPYLEAACQEALRLNPPVVDVGRLARRPFELLGYTVPAGEGVCPSPLLLHRRKDIYPEPSRFRPSRFLERKYSPFEYVPFGGGARRCLGAAFAMYELKIILGTLLGENRLRLARRARPVHVRRGITMGPRGGIPMVLTGRRTARAAEAGATVTAGA